METEIPEEVIEAIKEAIEKMHKIYSMLGIARKGGNVSIGFDSTKADIEKQ